MLGFGKCTSSQAFFVTKCPRWILDHFEDDLSFICWNDNSMTQIKYKMLKKIIIPNMDEFHLKIIVV